MLATSFLKSMCKKMGAAAGAEARRVGLLAALLVVALGLISGCPSPKGDQELQKEVESLKSEVAGLKEKVIALEASQKVILGMIKKEAPQEPAPGAAAGQLFPQVQPEPTMGKPITVEELFKKKDQLLGTRVTVKGVPGPVMMHKKTLFLQSPQGMVEVLYGNLQDRQQVERLTAQTIETPIIVSGLLSTAPGQTKEPVRLIIMADMVEF